MSSPPGLREIIVARLFALLPSVLAATVLVGWALGIEVMKRAGLGTVTMNPATALAFLLIVPGVFANTGKSRKLAGFGALLIGAAGCIGASKLIDLAAGSHFNVDTILFASHLTAGYARPSRMAPNTAFCFTLIATGLLLIRGRRERAVVAAQLFASLVAVVAVFTMVGHMYGVAAFYAVAALHPMALNSAIAFLSLSAFILLQTSECGLAARMFDRGPAGRTSRALLPAAVIIPVLFGWLRQQGESVGLYDHEIGIAIMVMLTMLSMTVLIWLNAGWLLASDKLRRLAEAEVAHMARHDHLTGLANRPHFMEKLVARMVPQCRRTQGPFAIITMDLDGFKQVNDRFGHAAGDALLRHVALFLKGFVFRQDDLVARLGGDEFVMLLDHITGIEEAVSVCERILANMSRRFGPQGEEVAIGISIGAVLAGRRHETPEALLNEADQALYQAKRSGKGRLAVAEEKPARASRVTDLPCRGRLAASVVF